MHFMSAVVCCSFAVHLWMGDTSREGDRRHCLSCSTSSSSFAFIVFVPLCAKSDQRLPSTCCSNACHTHAHTHTHCMCVSVPRMPHCVACCALIVQRKCCGGIKINKCISFPLGTLARQLQWRLARRAGAGGWVCYMYHMWGWSIQEQSVCKSDSGLLIHFVAL